MKNTGYNARLFDKSGSYTVQVKVDGVEIFKGKVTAKSLREAVSVAYSRVPLSVTDDRIEVKVIS